MRERRGKGVGDRWRWWLVVEFNKGVVVGEVGVTFRKLGVW